MAVELTANAVQAVPAGQNVLFTDAPVKCGRGYVVHREGAGLVTLRGICNGCSPIARYRVDVPRGCCVALSVRNVSAQAIDVANANLMIERVA